jgi:hypothetical protein
LVFGVFVVIVFIVVVFDGFGFDVKVDISNGGRPRMRSSAASTLSPQISGFILLLVLLLLLLLMLVLLMF